MSNFIAPHFYKFRGEVYSGNFVQNVRLGIYMLIQEYQRMHNSNKTKGSNFHGNTFSYLSFSYYLCSFFEILYNSVRGVVMTSWCLVYF